MEQDKIPLSPLLQNLKFFFDAMSGTSENYFYVTDFANDLVMLSPNIVRDFDIPATVVHDFNAYWLALVHRVDRGRYVKDIEAVLNHESEKHDVEYRVKDRNGEYVWIHCRGTVLFNEKGEPYLFAGQMGRMGRRNQADDVTGLLNKYQFEHAIKAVLNEYRITGTGGAVMIIGIDNFKIINETYNRYFGNMALKFIAGQIKAILPPMFTLFKLDGDEFGIVYHGAEKEDIDNLFFSIQTCMSRIKELDGKKFFCTISGGTVFYPEAGKESMVLHKHAEAALDMAKHDGKNRNCIFTKEQYDRWVKSLAMRDYLKNSVEKEYEGFSLYFQPLYDVQEKAVCGAEALLRWKSPQGKVVSPIDFISILESTKLIVLVGKWVAREAIKVCSEWQKLKPGFRISINVSYEQLKDLTFADFLLGTLEEFGLDAHSIILELTESTIVSDWNFLNRQFAMFRAKGISIAMDDFGTGYSSLAYLKNLSCDIIKIDREFVRRILESEFDCRLVSYAVELCHYVGIKTCIEGVETEEEYDLLTDVCKADYIQGYLFGRPENAEAFGNKFLVE